MYSIILMAAMTSGAEMPVFGHRRGCQGVVTCACQGKAVVVGCRGCAGRRTRGCQGACSGRGLFRAGRLRGGRGCYGGKGAVGCAGCSGAKADPKTGDKGKGGAKSVNAASTLVVSIPEGAKLTIDGMATKQTSSKRVFESPTLEPGQDYFYTLSASVLRDGKVVQIKKRVRVRAGETVPVSIQFGQESLVNK